MARPWTYLAPALGLLAGFGIGFLMGRTQPRDTGPAGALPGSARTPASATAW